MSKEVIWEWLERCPSLAMFKKLMDRGRLSEDSVEKYLYGVKMLTRFVGARDPEEALNFLREQETIEELLDKWIEETQKTAGAGQCANYLKGIKRWLILNHVNVSWVDVIAPPIYTMEEDRIPTVEEIKTLLNTVHSIRDRVLILTMCSSGLRIGTLLSLTFGDINLDYPDVARIMVRRGVPGRKLKRRKFYVTFITPEAKKLLMEYKTYRERKGEKITEASPLITSDRKLGAFLKRKYFSGPYWGRVLRQAGLTKKSVKWFELHLHVLRKFFETKCIDSNVKPSYREFWLGHKGSYLEDAYFRGEEENHLAEYRKAIPHLSVAEAPVMLTPEETEEMRALKKRVEAGLELAKKQVEEGGLLIAKLTKEIEALKAGKKEQRVIEDTDLENHLTHGWVFVATLNNGKVIVERR